MKYPNECTMLSAACKSEKAITVVSKFAFEHTDCSRWVYQSYSKLLISDSQIDM